MKMIGDKLERGVQLEGVHSENGPTLGTHGQFGVGRGATELIDGPGNGNFIQETQSLSIKALD